MKLGDVMQYNIIMLDPEDTIKKTLDLMNENHINGAPIVDKDKRLLGIVVKADIYRFLIEEGHYDTYPISSIMTKNVVSANLQEDVIDAAKKLIDNEIVAIPIVDRDKVVGIVSMENIIKYLVSKGE
ncbi:transcriptional repressor CcpN [Clostridium homopropionicum DSM 5847]|uniref:Transcriptional repressor CcpN n=1 Tax=Clostridium homopropionicum DSM 5847 TaxID=1121318 RepID=A0A0L6ZEM1_9CLOT|nr:CBS domain-containing protein [Clostridium homopropionicum]KOA21425.1 transcriptional repressor CcpN [Clostridium homopropionicum DSM 5847]SFG10286.1 CBS domain-containing protein [Clostridium homopropionicum]